VYGVRFTSVARLTNVRWHFGPDPSIKMSFIVLWHVVWSVRWRTCIGGGILGSREFAELETDPLRNGTEIGDRLCRLVPPPKQILTVYNDLVNFTTLRSDR